MPEGKNGAVPQPAQTHPKKDAYKKIVHQLETLNRDAETPYCQWRNRQVEKTGQAFYLQRITKEWEEMQKAGKAGGMDSDKRMLAGAVRIADLAVHMLCGLENGCTYRGILSGLEQTYKPYQDKLKSTGRLHEIKKGIDAAQNARDRQSLFCCLKSITDTALRMMVYLRTDYALELERRNSFQMQEKPPPAALSNPPVMEQDLERPSMAW